MLDKRYIIVTGPIGIGKTVYIKGMQKYNKDIQYIEVQNIHEVELSIRYGAFKIIEIHEINMEKEKIK